MAREPQLTVTRSDAAARASLSGSWVVTAAEAAEAAAARLAQETRAARSVSIDLSGVTRLDTAGAWIIDRARQELAAAGASVAYEGASPAHATLIAEAEYRVFETAERHAPGPLIGFLSDIGLSVVAFGRDLAHGVEFLGQVVRAIGVALLNPSHIRLASLVHHLENFGFRSVPIIALISFLVGAIVAQQGIFQLQNFGATHFAVDLVGLIALRELGVLLAAIMMAGRSGSAITAEIGSMKMREEIDAMRVMGLDPVELLIAPRILSLMIALPMLTFIADMAAIFGALIVSVTYGGLSPEIFFARLRTAIGLNTFLVGLIKAPFMALVTGIIASVEGLDVQGSAESLGRQVTASVVKAIFMVILVDGLFAMFFAAIKY
jgi:phospholipid/cholesterol/gamma-HCH transport system permease protein